MSATPVLLFSKKGSESAVVALRSHYTGIRVEGMERGDMLECYYMPSGRRLTIIQDGVWPLRTEDDESIRVKHSFGPGTLHVELVNGTPDA